MTPAPGPPPGRRAPTGLARHPQARILTQAVGVGLVAPAQPQQQESSPQQIRQRIADPTRRRYRCDEKGRHFRRSLGIEYVAEPN